MKKRRQLKIPRGTLEEQKLRDEKKTANQRALLFILPVVMMAILIAGLYFGYLSYAKNIRGSTATPSDVYFDSGVSDDDMLLRVVNSASPLDASYVPDVVTVDGFEVAGVMEESLKRLLADAEKEGLQLRLDGGYISYEEEKELYNAAVAAYKKKSKASTVKAESAVKRTIPKEGESERQTGLLVRFIADSDEKFEDTPESRWLLKNCVNYGFIQRYPASENAGGMSRSWTLYRYVGVENAYYIRAYDMNFDEYVNYLSSQ